MNACPLCHPHNERRIHADRQLRVILVEDSGYPGYCRVIWQAHVAEMTDLSPADSSRLMAVVLAVEDALRDVLRPAKINLASFGNVVPHLHWHVIPRFADDPHFPEPLWGARQREPDPVRLAERRARLPALRAAIAARLAAAR
ncbi:MAG: HIT family protein [Burkholderiales bacterium]|nr:HIT family protein [Burkholderiales bacterium]